MKILNMTAVFFLAFALPFFVASSELQLRHGEYKTGECPVPYVDISGHCFSFTLLDIGSWEDMREFCQRTNGDLAKVDSADLLHEIYHHLVNQGQTNKHFWLGGTDEGHEGVWTWLDKSEVKMGTPFWGVSCESTSTKHQPDGGANENCLYIPGGIKYSFFSDEACSALHSAICELNG